MMGDVLQRTGIERRRRLRPQDRLLIQGMAAGMDPFTRGTCAAPEALSQANIERPRASAGLAMDVQPYTGTFAWGSAG